MPQGIIAEAVVDEDLKEVSGADCIQIDLEDSVPPAEKDRARTLVPAVAARVRRGGADVVVRINRPLPMAVRDLEASVGPDVDGIAVTKVQGADHLKLLDELVSELEVARGLKVGHTRFIAMVETPAAFFRMAEIAGAVGRLAAMNAIARGIDRNSLELAQNCSEKFRQITSWRMASTT